MKPVCSLPFRESGSLRHNTAQKLQYSPGRRIEREELTSGRRAEVFVPPERSQRYKGIADFSSHFGPLRLRVSDRLQPTVDDQPWAGTRWEHTCIVQRSTFCRGGPLAAHLQFLRRKLRATASPSSVVPDDLCQLLHSSHQNAAGRCCQQLASSAIGPVHLAVCTESFVIMTTDSLTTGHMWTRVAR